MTDVSTTCAEAIFRVKKMASAQDLTLKMASAQVVEASVTNNSPSQDSYHPDDLFQSRYATPGFKPFSYLVYFTISLNHLLIYTIYNLCFTY